ncbi:hypothetical protein V1605_06180 [Enterobacter soli]|nr:hypothetical protein [Enterobacter soli]
MFIEHGDILCVAVAGWRFAYPAYVRAVVGPVSEAPPGEQTAT